MRNKLLFFTVLFLSLFVVAEAGHSYLQEYDSRLYNDSIILDETLNIQHDYVYLSNISQNDNLTSCGIINESGEYSLTNNISSQDTCIVVTVDDVIIDGQGFTVSYGGGGASNRYAFDLMDRINVTVRNVNITESNGSGQDKYAFRFRNTYNSTVDNITALTLDGPNNKRASIIRLRNSGYNVINNSIMRTNGHRTAVVHLQNSHDNILQNSNLTNFRYQSYPLHIISESNNNLIKNVFVEADGFSNTAVRVEDSHQNIFDSLKVRGGVTRNHVFSNAMWFANANHTNVKNSDIDTRGLESYTVIHVSSANITYYNNTITFLASAETHNTYIQATGIVMTYNNLTSMTDEGYNTLWFSGSSNGFVSANYFNSNRVNLRLRSSSSNITVYNNTFEGDEEHIINYGDNKFIANISGQIMGNKYEGLGDIRIFDSDGDGFGDSGPNHPISFNSWPEKWKGLGNDSAPFTERLPEPVVESVSINSGPLAFNNLDLIGSCDISHELETSITYNYTWWRDGTEYVSSVINGSTGKVNVSTILSNETNPNETWIFECRGDDGERLGEARNSSAVTISTVELETVITEPQGFVDNNKNVKGFCRANQEDMMLLGYYYAWYINEAEYRKGFQNGFTSGEFVNVDDLNKAETNLGDEIVFECTAYDGTINSTTLNSSILGVTTAPSIKFNDPTPANNTRVSDEFLVNASLTGEKFAKFSLFVNEMYDLFDDSFVLGYNFDNITGLGDSQSAFTDFSRNNIFGICNGTECPETIKDGLYGSGLEFNGAYGVSSNKSIKISNDFTVSFWAKNSINTPNNFEFIFSTNQYGEDNSLNVYFSQNGDNILADLFDSAGSLARAGQTGFGFESEKWYHITLLLEAGNFYLYIDGEEIDSSPVSNNFEFDSNLFFAGPADGSENWRYYGKLDEVRVWNRSLSNTELDIIYTSNFRKKSVDSFEFFWNASVEQGLYSLQVLAENIYGSSNSSEVRTVLVGEKVPAIGSFKGDTTRVNDVLDYDSVGNFTLEKTLQGKITWINNVNISTKDFDSYVNISDNFISVNSEMLGVDFNSSANIKFYNITWKKPLVLRDGVLCGDCVIQSYENSTLEVLVPGFSMYTTVEGEEEQEDMMGGGRSSSSSSQVGGEDIVIAENMLRSGLSVSPYRLQDVVFDFEDSNVVFVINAFGLDYVEGTLDGEDFVLNESVITEFNLSEKVVRTRYDGKNFSKYNVYFELSNALNETGEGEAVFENVSNDVNNFEDSIENTTVVDSKELGDEDEEEVLFTDWNYLGIVSLVFVLAILIGIVVNKIKTEKEEKGNKNI